MRRLVRPLPRTYSRPRWRLKHSRQWGLVVTYETEESKSVADSGVGADAVTATLIAKDVTVTDSGTGAAATPTVTATLAVSDTGAGAEVINQLLRGLLLQDTGGGSDAISQILAALAIAETGTGSDAVTRPGAAPSWTFIPKWRRGRMGGRHRLGRNITRISRLGTSGGRRLRLVQIFPATLALNIYVSDVGLGSDGTPAITVGLSVSDAGTGVMAIGGAASVPVADTGAGADTATLGVSFVISDAATAADAVQVVSSGVILIDEDGFGTDSIGPVTVSASVADAAAGADSQGITVSLSVADVGAGADLIDVVKALTKYIAEAGHGADAVGPITVQVPVGDTGQGVDALSGIVAALSVLDSGAGLDAVVKWDPTVKIATITFTLRKRTTGLELKTRTIGLELN